MQSDDLQDTLRNLETKLVARIRFVLSAYVLKRIEEIKKDDEALELSPHNPSNNRRAISPSMSTRPSFNGQVSEGGREGGNEKQAYYRFIHSRTITHPITIHPITLYIPQHIFRCPLPLMFSINTFW